MSFSFTVIHIAVLLRAEISHTSSSQSATCVILSPKNTLEEIPKLKETTQISKFYIENVHIQSNSSLKEYFVPSGVAIPDWTGRELCQFQSSLFQLKWTVYGQRNDLPQCSVNQPKTNSNILLLWEVFFLEGLARRASACRGFVPGPWYARRLCRIDLAAS